MGNSIVWTPPKARSDIKASVGVGFGEKAGAAPGTLPGQNQPKWLLEASNRPPIIPKPGQIGPVASYFCVHPAAAELILSTTSGSVNESASKLQKHVYEVIAFSGSNIYVELKYPKPTNVKFMIYGSLVPAGLPHSIITLNYDSTRNIIKTSALCYGMVKVEYYAPYDLWLATFGYSTKPAPVIIDPLHPGDPEDDKPLPGLDPMTILGKYKVVPIGTDPDTILCSLQLQPPTNNAPGTAPGGEAWAFMFGTDSQMPKLYLEIDPNDPVALKPSLNQDGNPEAGCSILVTPSVEPQYSLTSGYITTSESIGGQAISQMLTFSGSSSAQLHYQPAGSLSLAMQGMFVNREGEEIIGAHLAPPNSDVIVVDWNPYGVAINMRHRITNIDEVVLLDGTGYTIAGYGIVQADYGIAQWRMGFRFTYDTDKKEFIPAWMVATIAGPSSVTSQTATLQIQPPTMKKVK